MKTTSYNAAKEIRIGILLVVFTMAIFTAFKVKELQVNDENNGATGNTYRTEASESSYSSLPVLDAKLIEEPALEAEAIGNIAYNAHEIADAEMAMEIESWMNSGVETNREVAEPAIELEALISTIKYNAQEFVDAEMANENQNWLKINEETNIETIDAELASQMKVWISAPKYNAKEFAEAEMAAEIENFRNN